jgi:hypothetical protein
MAYMASITTPMAANCDSGNSLTGRLSLLRNQLAGTDSVDRIYTSWSMDGFSARQTQGMTDTSQNNSLGPSGPA